MNGPRIVEARAAADLSVAQLAKLSGVSGTVLRGLEAGAADCSVPTIGALAKALGLSVDSLLAPNPAWTSRG